MVSILVRRLLASTRKIRTPEPFSMATARTPSQSPHCAPERKVAPLVATVGKPERHFALIALGKRFLSVIGRDSLYPGVGLQP